MRAAVYSGTRNLYPHMVVAAKSLIANSGVEKIYFLIEDDKFPDKLPPLIETKNVSGQTWFPKDGPNMKSQFSYMALVRACYCKLLPETLDTVLQLDVDTIVVNNVDKLLDMKMGRKWFAACDEPNNNYWRPFGNKYYNVGVAMFNLKAIRRCGVDDTIIKFLNEEETPFVEQDGWNKFSTAQEVIDLDTRYNESVPTGYTDNPAVVHWAGFKNWWDDPKAPRREYYKKYKDMTWEEAFACRKS